MEAHFAHIPDEELVSPELVLVDPLLRLRLASAPVAAPPRPVAPRVVRSSESTVTISPQARRRGARIVAATGGSLVTLAALFAVGALHLPAGNPGAAQSIRADQPRTPVPKTISTVDPSRPTTRVAKVPATKRPSTPVPKATSPVDPSRPAARVATVPATQRPTTRTFAWAPVAGAAAYEVALYRRSTRVFHLRTRADSAALPIGSLPNGTYEWYVWPVRNGTRDDVASVRSQLKLSASSR